MMPPASAGPAASAPTRVAGARSLRMFKTPSLVACRPLETTRRPTEVLAAGQNAGGSVLQLAGSAPIFSPRSARLFIVSLTNTPATGGDQSPGIDTTRTSMSALRLSREISAIAKRWRTAVAVAARVDVFMLCWITATQFGAITSGTGRNWLLKITQKRILGIGRFG